MGNKYLKVENIYVSSKRFCFFSIILWFLPLIREIYNNWLYHVSRSSQMGDDFLHYHVLPSELTLNNSKIIFLWTTYFGDYRHWSWGIGPEPEISDCTGIKNGNQSCLKIISKLGSTITG